MEIKLKRGKSNGFTTYCGTVDGVEFSITNLSTKFDHSIIKPFCIHMKGLPYQYGGYCYRTLTEAREALSKLKEARDGND